MSSFGVSMTLGILPLSDTVAILMPSWTLLTLLYWCIALPQKVSIGTGWLTGILVDVLTGNLLGLHALIYSTGAYLSHKLHPQLRNLPAWQQAIILFSYLMLAQTVSLSLKHANAQLDLPLIYWLPALSSALCWPFMFKALRFIRRHYRIS